MAHISFMPDGFTPVILTLPNAETLDPQFRDVGSDAVAMDGQTDQLHYRSEHRLTLRVRKIPDCAIESWYLFHQASTCRRFTIDLDGRLAWCGWDLAEAHRERDMSIERDGAGFWQVNMTLVRFNAEL